MNCKNIKSKFYKRKKKKAFTLIEMISVIAIIGILASAILPRVNGYIKEAKKVKVLDQCRKIVMAAESYELRNNSLQGDTTVLNMKNNDRINKYLDNASLGNLPDGTTLSQCYLIINGAEFDIEGSNDMLKNTSITTVASAT